MMKSLIIGIEAAIILGLIMLLYSVAPQNKRQRVVRFPEAQLGTNERIIEARMVFQTAHIRAIRNIPPEWYVVIDLNTPPNPIFKGSIIVGAAALGSTKELPEFEVDNYVNDAEPIALKAILAVAQYPGNIDKLRQIEIEMGTL
jgi:hypothetical protein